MLFANLNIIRNTISTKLMMSNQTAIKPYMTIIEKVIVGDTI